MPPNWLQLPQSFIIPLQSYVRESGLCLSWVPDPDTVRALFRAGTEREARDAALVDNRDAIVVSCRECASTFTAQELGPLPDACVEIVDAIDSGFFRAGQALAAAAVTEILDVHFAVGGKRRFAEYVSRIELEPPNRAHLRTLRRVEVQWALRHAIEKAITTNV